MAFSSIPSAWIAVGAPIKQELLQRISDDLDYLNSATLGGISTTLVTFSGTNTYTVPAVSGLYYIDTSGATGDVTITLPDTSSSNDTQVGRIVAKDVTHNVKVVTTSGQEIGNLTEQVITRADKAPIIFI